MPPENPPNAEDLRQTILSRLSALEEIKGAQERITVEWRGRPNHIPVISMPLGRLYYNPDTHRLRAQRSMNPSKERELETDPFGESAQIYLDELLKGDPTDPSKTDPSFVTLKDDLSQHGQTEPGIITRSGILINGNTRRAALKELGEKNIRVGVLPADAGFDDWRAVELSLQLRKDYKRDYSYMNFLLAVEERELAGELAANIQAAFRIRAKKYDESRWVLDLVKEAIARSRVDGAGGKKLGMRLVDFETHQGKLEELYRAYITLKAKAPDQAEILREQRLLALIFDKSKTDLRLIDSEFSDRYMKGAVPPISSIKTSNAKIPGLSVTVAGPSQEIQAYKQLTTSILQARAVARERGEATPEQAGSADSLLQSVGKSLDDGLYLAEKQSKSAKRRFAPVDRLSDACDELELSVAAVAEARSKGAFDPADLDEILMTLKSNLEKLSAIVGRGSSSDAEGLSWIRAVGRLGRENG
jgi:hypothetical protein